MTHSPFKQFAEWFDDAKARSGEPYPNAMTLATARKSGAPSARIVLLKAFDERGFVCYTNLGSRKSEELKENPQAALCFYWSRLGRQIRIEGEVAPVSDEEADAYFAGRPFLSRLGAIASNQSRVLDARETFLKKIDELQKIYSGENPPPRPAYWSGWRLVPKYFEFWQEGEFRLHEREVFIRTNDNWRTEKLYP